MSRMSPMSKFMQDMSEQPQAIERLLASVPEVAQKADELDRSRVLFTGMGASLHACTVGVTYLRSRGIDARSVEMSELIAYESRELLEGYSTIFLMSQSGESAELIRFMEDNFPLLKRMALITNNPDSTAAKKLPRTRVFSLQAGRERSMGATKTFTNSILATLLIAQTWTGEELDFSSLPARVEEGLALEVGGLVDSLSRERERILVARGYGIGVGRMARLMFAEVAKLSLIFYSGAAFRHGPLELLKDGPVVVTFNPFGETTPLMEALHADICDKCDLITLTNVTNVSTGCGKPIHVSKDLPEVISPIPMLSVLQKSAEKLAQKRGFDPGEGIFGTKVTTKE